MKTSHWKSIVVGAFVTSFAIWPVQAQQTPPPASTGAAAATSDQRAPADLAPLLAAPQSEMRLVAQRYNADRSTLSGNYEGNARGGGAGGQIPTGPTSLSIARIARLKRHDLDWQAAIGRIDAGKLSAAGKADLEALKTTIGNDLVQQDINGRAIAELTPVLPFAASLVQAIESRIRIEKMDAEATAALLSTVLAQVATASARLTAGLSSAGPDAMRLPKDLATRAADATEALRRSLAEWNTFYDGYDPSYSWWVRLPYKQLDTALVGYATLLRDKVAPADQQAVNLPAASTTPIAPASAPKLNGVPDLAEIIALPQDEMRDIVDRFRAVAGGAGITRSGARQGGPAPTAAFYQSWLQALPSLNFDALSRNAQVDYLFIKRMSETAIARESLRLPANPPRKTDNSGIVGPARGRDGLIVDLNDEMIPYTPEQLIALANREFEWCEAEMKKASRQMGFGDDWKKAVAKVKDIHPPAGDQTYSVRDLMFEAVDFLRAKDLVTVPQVAAESLHMIMMTPQRQLVNPFFTGGSEISVSYPHESMAFDARLQSMRGNNTPFSHATAFHEVIPGHNLVGFMSSRFAGYRANIGSGTPFFGEGWPLYWELTMYELGFDATPEQKVGALFWRMHRCARIIFSLNFHMGLWSPQDCIDFLVEKVGHERDNATAEVRRSFDPSQGYGPLYQAAYLLGGLQLRGLRKELVDSGQMTNRAFHDEILRQRAMPIALIRLGLTRQKLTRDMDINWKFYGDLK